MVYRFYLSSRDWPPADTFAIGGLVEMVTGGLDITRATFLKHVDEEQLAEIEARLGYTGTEPMANDPRVTYHRSTHHGERVYFFRRQPHDEVNGRATEYVFKQEAA